VLINARSIEGRAKCHSFPFEVFERAVLGLLREIDPREITDDDGPGESAILAEDLSRAGSELAEAQAFMDANGFSATIGKRVQSLEARIQELTERLADARQRAGNPAGKAWAEARSLMAVIDESHDPADVRLRLRMTLRRVVDGVWCLFAGRGRTRLALVQVWFKGGQHRVYLIRHDPPQSNGVATRPGGWRSRSLPYEEKATRIDLRDPKQAARAAKELEQEPMECDPSRPASNKSR
jgi:hypothetical protein